MKEFLVRALVPVLAIGFLALAGGCARDGAARGTNTGAFAPKSAADSQASMKIDGMFYTAAKSGTRDWRREVMKVSPVTSSDQTAAANHTYSLVLAGNARSPNSVLWQVVSTRRLFRNGTPAANEPSEPVVEVLNDGTVSSMGPAPIVIVKRATIAAEGTKFAIEAVAGGGWSLAVFEAPTPVNVYFDASTVRSVAAGQCIRFPEAANSVDDGQDSSGDYSRLYDYAKALWAATGTTNY